VRKEAGLAYPPPPVKDHQGRFMEGVKVVECLQLTLAVDEFHRELLASNYLV
jgi:hypothetical protein